VLIKQRTQNFLTDLDSSLNPLEQFASDELDSNRNRLLTAVRALYSGPSGGGGNSDSDSDSDSDSGSGSSEDTEGLAAIELMFTTPDTPEYSAMTDVLVRFIAVRDALVTDSD
jgi:hypothetical protein